MLYKTYHYHQKWHDVLEIEGLGSGVKHELHAPRCGVHVSPKNEAALVA